MASPPPDDVVGVGDGIGDSVPDGEKTEPAVEFAPTVPDDTGPPASSATSAAAATTTADEPAASEDLTKVGSLRSLWN